jgi:ABC-type transport system involved in multi-copper enzyme maturation permease subunit
VSLAQRFAQIFGIVYVLVGIAGFIPPLLTGNLSGVMGPFAGLLLGLFAVNWFHSLTHLAIGAVGVAVYRSHSASMTYALALGVAYAVLFLLGIFSGSVATLGGLLPLNGIDDLLHIATALVAFGAYFASRDTADARRAEEAR